MTSEYDKQRDIANEGQRAAVWYGEQHSTKLADTQVRSRQPAPDCKNSEASSTPSEAMFLIEKRGLYYRPDAKGYTGLKREAGLYSFDDAVERVGPNGPEGPQDGMGIWRVSEAPQFSTNCPFDVKAIETVGCDARREALEDAAKLADAFVSEYNRTNLAQSWACERLSRAIRALKT